MNTGRISENYIKTTGFISKFTNKVLFLIKIGSFLI